MTAFLEDLEVIDPTAVEQSGPQYIKGQWHNGDQKLKQAGGVAYTGGLFIDRDKYLPDFVQATAEWKNATIVFESGKSVNVLASARPSLAVIRTRFRWFVTKGGETTYYSRNEYKQGANMRGHLQALCGVEGYDFPVVFTFKGMASKHFDTAVREFSAKVGEASARAMREKGGTTGQQFPRYAFYMDIVPGAHEKVGEKGQESTITPPTLALPDKIDTGYLSKAYVGRERLQAMQLTWHEATDWAAAWDKAAPAAEPEPEDDNSASAAAVDTALSQVELTDAAWSGGAKKRPSTYDENL